MSYVMVDIEADGPIPGDYSMVCFGAVIVEPALDRTFYAALAPISEKWVAEALQVTGFSREATLKFAEPGAEMVRFESWLKDNVQGRAIFVADNNGFDWQSARTCDGCTANHLSRAAPAIVSGPRTHPTLSQIQRRPI